MRPEQIYIGYSRNIPALQQIVAQPNAEGGWVEKHVYFGYPTRIYTMVLECPSRDSKAMDREFGYFLATVQYKR